MIEAYSFGSITVDGQTYTKDLKIIGGQVTQDWWRNQGHLVDVEDVQDILSARPDYLVIGTGANGLMKVAESLRASLKANQIQLMAQASAQAVDTFNRLCQEGKNVAAAFHLTC